MTDWKMKRRKATCAVGAAALVSALISCTNEARFADLERRVKALEDRKATEQKSIAAGEQSSPQKSEDAKPVISAEIPRAATDDASPAVTNEQWAAANDFATSRAEITLLCSSHDNLPVPELEKLQCEERQLEASLRIRRRGAGDSRNVGDFRRLRVSCFQRFRGDYVTRDLCEQHPEFSSDTTPRSN
jgi:hypothetical protein